MPVTYNIDNAKKLIRITCASPMTFAEVLEHFQALRKEPDFIGRMDGFVDLSGADLLMDTSQLGAVTTELRALHDKAQYDALAIVATSDAMFGTARMFEAFASPYLGAIRVFRDLAQAEAWITSRLSSPRREP